VRSLSAGPFAPHIAHYSFLSPFFASDPAPRMITKLCKGMASMLR
jgi:hypothetical protein